MKKPTLQNPSNLRLRATGSPLLVLALAAHAASNAPAAPAASSAQFTKPSWLTELSLGAKESYDNNVLMVSDEGPMSPEDSWVTTVSPRVGLNLLPLTGGTNLLQTLSFAYTPDFVSYHNATDENYNAHRLANVIKGKSGAFSFNLENAFSFIDGNHDAVTYVGLDSLRSAYATATTRERKYQWQDRAKVSLRYDLEKFFFRPTAALTYYELMTTQQLTAGYQNYADRYDVNGGLDFGFKIDPKWALTLGYRYGHQYQEQYVWDATNLSSPSDYQRGLVGIEGKPLKWLTINLQAGPDFRNYADNTATHTTPVDDPNLVTYYGEGSLTADITANDSVAVRYRGWQWVSSTGRIPYFDTSVGLTYRHKFGKALAFDLGGSASGSDYNSANVASGKRNDWMYAVTTGLGYTLSPNASFSLNYIGNFGRNLQDGLMGNGRYREFDQHIVALGAVIKL